jgi:hypothetical protein
MLHATALGKSPLFRRYLPAREDNQRVHAEDEITSAVFGPLAFMEPAACFRICAVLLRQGARQAELPTAPPGTATVRFWPPGASVEPDLLVEFDWPDGQQCRFLIELKWRAGLSGHDQLHKQWRAFAPDPESLHTWHLLIAHGAGRTISRVADPADGDIWTRNGQRRLVGIDWKNVRDALAICRHGAPHVSTWANLALEFLDRVGVHRFDGFDCAGPLPTLRHVPFFTAPATGFAGFSSCPPLSPAPFISFFSSGTRG